MPMERILIRISILRSCWKNVRRSVFHVFALLPAIRGIFPMIWSMWSPNMIMWCLLCIYRCSLVIRKFYVWWDVAIRKNRIWNCSIKSRNEFQMSQSVRISLWVSQMKLMNSLKIRSRSWKSANLIMRLRLSSPRVRVHRQLVWKIRSI